jgi:hypothetical protein
MTLGKVDADAVGTVAAAGWLTDKTLCVAVKPYATVRQARICMTSSMCDGQAEVC